MFLNSKKIKSFGINALLVFTSAHNPLVLQHTHSIINCKAENNIETETCQFNSWILCNYTCKLHIKFLYKFKTKKFT